MAAVGGIVLLLISARKGKKKIFLSWRTIAVWFRSMQSIHLCRSLITSLATQMGAAVIGETDQECVEYSLFAKWVWDTSWHSQKEPSHCLHWRNPIHEAVRLEISCSVWHISYVHPFLSICLCICSVNTTLLYLCRWLVVRGSLVACIAMSLWPWMWWCAPQAYSTCVPSALTGKGDNNKCVLFCGSFLSKEYSGFSTS